ncbi:DUF134 domain-containing protein [Paenibacillus sp. FSL R7-0128]|uniref:DUF134 domain-containing protein n=1 Tax=Paenibacillus sp. FSL R7-0128 TaxID=2954529 RepID=UPI0030FC3618
MGSVKIDIDKGARTYAVRYALNDAAGVKKLLRDRHAVSSARFNGDYNAADILIDLHSAISSAILTVKQTEAIAWVYGADLTQKDAAEIMGVARSTLVESVESAAEKVAEVYKRWNYGEVTAEYPLEEGAA